MKLSAYELWMVKSNLQRIEQGEKNIVKTLIGNGYKRVAKEVERLSTTE